MLTIVSVVLLGFGFELNYLAWLYAADRGLPWQAAMLSMLTGTVSLVGITAVVENHGNAPWLILGYGLGSYAAASFKRSRSGGRG